MPLCIQYAICFFNESTVPTHRTNSFLFNLYSIKGNAFINDYVIELQGSGQLVMKFERIEFENSLRAELARYLQFARTTQPFSICDNTCEVGFLSLHSFRSLS